MSFQGLPAFNILLPTEVAMLQRVYDRVVKEENVPGDPHVRTEFARLVLKMHKRGLCSEPQLYEFCRVAARRKFSKVSAASQETELLQ